LYVVASVCTMKYGSEQLVPYAVLAWPM